MIPLSFYQDQDVITVAKALIGKHLFTCFEGKLTGGVIVETEAYAGAEDRASHTYKNRRTPRTEILFAKGGVAYVYLCYGMHHLLNFVIGDQDVPHGVLIRAIRPTHGLEIMQQRRKKSENLTMGPGALTAALGITLKQYGQPLNSETLWVEEGVLIDEIQVTPRIGVDYAGNDALLPYRFLAK